MTKINYSVLNKIFDNDCFFQSVGAEYVLDENGKFGLEVQLGEGNVNHCDTIHGAYYLGLLDITAGAAVIISEQEKYSLLPREQIKLVTCEANLKFLDKMLPNDRIRSTIISAIKGYKGRYEVIIKIMKKTEIGWKDTAFGYVQMKDCVHDMKSRL